MNRRINLSLPIVIAVLVCHVGCDEPAEVRQYRIQKQRSDLGDIGKKLRADKATESRMVVAIARRDDATWFFKITGPVAAVNQAEEQWSKLLSDVGFADDGKPTWSLPDNWIAGPDRQMRFATLLTNVAEKGPVEMSISSLGPNQDLLSNVNRWRGQMSLPPVEETNLKLEKMMTSGGEMLIFDEIGVLDARPVSMPLPEESPLIYEVPNGWIEGTTNAIVKVRLKKDKTDDATQITVTQLIASVNEWLPNAQRWSDQVGMPTDEEFLSDRTTDVTIDQISGKKIQLIPDDGSNDLAMIGAMIVRDDLAWFFKMIGDRDVVMNNKSAFDEFLTSFRFN